MLYGGLTVVTLSFDTPGTRVKKCYISVFQISDSNIYINPHMILSKNQKTKGLSYFHIRLLSYLLYIIINVP